jgi:predicted dithiol-disulfide oxidoreductase (DUF899 family)
MPGKIGSPKEWRTARHALLEREKAHVRAGDALAAEVRALPMVPVTKEYTFHGTDGSAVALKDLFANRSQLIVYHFMFDPEWEDACRGCSFLVSNLPDIRHLHGKFP